MMITATMPVSTTGSDDAALLARTISSFRAATGTRIRAHQRRTFRLLTRDGDTMTGITGKLPHDEAAVVAASTTSTPPTVPKQSDVAKRPERCDLRLVLDGIGNLHPSPERDAAIPLATASGICQRIRPPLC